MPDTKLLDAAIRLLARREHGRRELRRKLAGRGASSAAVDEVLDHLRDRGLQSDDRFARDFATSRVRRGHGPVRIRADLRSRGVDEAVVEGALLGLEVDGRPVEWAEVARETARRRWDAGPPPDRKERARRWRFLARRGFPSGVIGSALAAVETRALALLLALGVLLPGLLVAAGAEAQGIAQVPETPAVVVFEGVTVISMEPGAEPAAPGRTVVVRDGRIAEVGAVGEVEVPEGALRVDGSGRYLIPGLAEMHAHVPPSADPPREEVEEILFLFVANGVTTMRGMLGAPWQLELREELARGEVLGPRFFVGAPSLNGNTAPDAAAAEARVRAHAEAGYDLLKIHPGLPLESWDRMVEVAREVGITWAGHVPAAVGIEHAVRTGISTVDHLDGYLEATRLGDLPEGAGLAQRYAGTDEAALDALLELTAREGTWMVPTQYLWDNLMGRIEDPEALLEEEEFRYVSPGQREAWLRTARQRGQRSGMDADASRAHAEWRHHLLSRLHEAGVPMLMGTDSPQLMNVPGFAVHRELPLMEAAGMTPLEVLASGTVNVARYVEEELGMEADFGQVVPGMAADLVLLEANPLDDLGALRDPAGVMVQGAWLSGEEIRSRLEALARRHAGEG